MASASALQDLVERLGTAGRDGPLSPRGGGTVILDFVERRTAGVIPEDCYEGAPEAILNSFCKDVQMARAVVHKQRPATRIVSMCVLMNVLEETCNSWLCPDIASAVGLPTSAPAFLLAIECRFRDVGRVTKNTLRLFLRSIDLLVDLEKHIRHNPRHAFMMPGGIQALNVAKFATVTLEEYLELMALTGRKTSNSTLKRHFKDI